MKKLLLIVFIISYGCGFKPLYSDKEFKNLEFSEITLSGNTSINRKIISYLKISKKKNDLLETLKLDSNFENKVFTHADIIVLNTYGDKKMYSNNYSRIKDKFLVVRNGYTVQNSAESRRIKEDDFTFVYAGGTYRGVVPEKLASFFENINFNENRFSCHCYGEYDDVYKTNEYFDFRGKVSQKELFDVLKSYKYGIIYLPERYKSSFRVTQKLYDYIGAGLIPIVINASIEIRQIIQELGYGFVFNEGFNKDLIENFISQIENHGDICTNQDLLKEFTRDYQFSKITAYLK